MISVNDDAFDDMTLWRARVWLRPNDCRIGPGWPTAPRGDDISTPNTSAAAIAGSATTRDNTSKVASLEERRHAAD